MMTHIPTTAQKASNETTPVPQPPELLFTKPSTTNTSAEVYKNYKSYPNHHLSYTSNITNNSNHHNDPSQIVPLKLQKKRGKTMEEKANGMEVHHEVHQVNSIFEPSNTLNLSPSSSSTNNSNQLSDAESSLSDESTFPSIMGSPSSSDGKKLSSTSSCSISRKPIRTIVNNSGRPRNNSAASSSSSKKMTSSLIRNNNSNQPTLGFSSDFSVSGTPSFVFTCKEGFIQNDSKKAPPDTFFNVTIRDSIAISSEIFNKCTCILKLKDGSPEGISVSTETFKPSNSNNSTTFECTITIPQKITTIKGSSSSRIGYIEIYNQKEECIAVSSFFWIRSRSRLQLDKDTKRKQVSEPTNSSVIAETIQPKRKREQFDHAEGIISEESEKKVVKIEEPSSTKSTVQQQQPQQQFVNTNALPPISSLYSPSTVYTNEPQPSQIHSVVDQLFFEINSLRQQVASQQEQIKYLMERK